MSLLQKITVSKFLEYCTIIKDLNEEYNTIANDETINDNRKNVLLTTIFVKRAKKTFEHFHHINLLKRKGESTKSYVNKDSVDFFISWYNAFNELFNEVDCSEEAEQKLLLPSWKLTPLNPINFGQFVDSKMMVEGGINDGHSKWVVVQYIMAIFLLRKGIKYHESFINEESTQFIRCGSMNLEVAIIVSKWFDKLNEYINSHFTLFQDNGMKKENQENIETHMKRWGWVNFTKNVAKTKAFDISGSGKNSIECVRETNCNEILTWASEEKEYNVAIDLDMKASAK